MLAGSTDPAVLSFEITRISRPRHRCQSRQEVVWLLLPYKSGGETSAKPLAIGRGVGNFADTEPLRAATRERTTRRLLPIARQLLAGLATMFAPTRLRSLGMAAPLPATANLPAFLLPAFQTTAPRRALSATAARQSRLGRRPVYVPPEVEVSLGEPYVVEDLTTYLRIPRRNLTVSGPLGWLTRGCQTMGRR